MDGRQWGFTLLEVMIVVAILAVVAAIGIPNLLSAKIRSNEAAAIATLKSIASAQEQAKAAGAIDINRNGVGEYCYFGELAAGVGLRTDEVGTVGSDRMMPAQLSGAFGAVRDRFVSRSGYTFALLLPSGANQWTWEAAEGGAAGRSVAAVHAENFWGCYAWPNSWGTSGRRAFYVNQSGEVLVCKNNRQRYSGSTSVVEGYAAVHAAVSPPGTMASTLAANATGLDGEFWHVVK